MCETLFPGVAEALLAELFDGDGALDDKAELFDFNEIASSTGAFAASITSGFSNLALSSSESSPNSIFSIAILKALFFLSCFFFLQLLQQHLQHLNMNLKQLQIALSPFMAFFRPKQAQMQKRNTENIVKPDSPAAR